MTAINTLPASSLPVLARIVTTLVLMQLPLAACAADASPEPPARAPMTEPGLRPRVELALADAAKRTGLDASALVVQRAERVTWRDGALGCPQPGMAYTQALVPGWRIELQAPGQAALLYHASRRGGWLWCPRERAQPPLPAAADPSI